MSDRLTGGMGFWYTDLGINEIQSLNPPTRSLTRRRLSALSAIDNVTC